MSHAGWGPKAYQTGTGAGERRSRSRVSLLSKKIESVRIELVKYMELTSKDVKRKKVLLSFKTSLLKKQ